MMRYFTSVLDSGRIGLIAIGTAVLMIMGNGYSDITTGLVGQLKFDETSGTTASDASGNGHTGTISGSAAWQTGKYGNSLNFDQTNDYVSVPTFTYMNSTNKTFTISLWFKTPSNATGANQLRFFFEHASSANNSNRIYSYIGETTTSDRLRTGLFNGSAGGPGSTALDSTGFGAYCNDAWHLYTLVIDGTNSNVKVYLDGVNKKTSTAWNTSSTFAPTSVFRIGCGFSGGTSSGAAMYWFKGNIDEFRIYNRALTATDVTELYNYNPSGTAPTITTQPVSQTINAGSPVTFTVVATGNPTPTYQWKKGGTNISGATSSSYTISSVQSSDAGSYTVTVTNTAGNVTSNAATLTVNYAPSITTHPVSQTINASSPVSFTVVATGNPTPTYQWKKGGSNISGATSASYTISSVQPSDAGSFTVTVTNTVGNVTSNAATLTVNYIPSITTHPLSQTINAGSPVTFSVVATGNPAPTYQWKKGGTDISGATSANYTISSVLTSDAGSYTVTVTNTRGSVTSNAATLTVTCPLPVITVQPISQTKDEGQTVTFNVTATGTGLSYQWRKGSDNIAGANADAYTIPVLEITHSGSYTVVVTNSCGPVTSNPATLTVNYIAPVITQEPLPQTATVGGTATFTIGATTRSGVLTLQWRLNGTPISGANGLTYTTPTLTLANNGDQYSCLVKNPPGNAEVSSQNALLTVTETAVPPTITAQPVDQSVTVGQPATFSVTATGTQPLSYQWKKEGTDIFGATASAYTISATILADNNTHYTCVVTNSVSSVTSASATLLVSTAPVVYAYPEDCGLGENMKVDGNVIIGAVTNPTEMLEVAGNIKGDQFIARRISATELVATPKWKISPPDYVFAPGYKLETLQEIEAYLKANQHLKDIPSAEDMMKNGVQMVELNMLLLKKVEELTLHAIELNRKIESLQNSQKVNSQKSK